MRWFKALFLFLFLSLYLFSLPSQAGFFELGVSTTYRKINLPRDAGDDAFDESYAFTASGAYYFAEMAALELSLTKGKAERFVPSTDSSSVRTTHNYSIAGMDLIFTFAKRTDPFVPYTKVGVAYFIDKYIDYQFTDSIGNVTPDRVNLDSNFVPSFGFGLRIRLTQSMAFKIGMEAWTSDSLGSNPQFDIAGKAGVSWLF